ncbi:MAG: type II toxin-antitoxin system HicA family toxin [Chlamydiales bacterium]|nr:type II toxin-antitoxin system HicA family toxin [Chlamydiales bacterium]
MIDSITRVSGNPQPSQNVNTSRRHNEVEVVETSNRTFTEARQQNKNYADIGIGITTRMILEDSLFSRRLELGGQESGDSHHDKVITAKAIRSEPIVPMNKLEEVLDSNATKRLNSLSTNLELSVDVKKDFDVLYIQLQRRNFCYPSKRIIDAIYMYANELYTKVADRNGEAKLLPAQFTSKLALFRCVIESACQPNQSDEFAGECWAESLGEHITDVRRIKNSIQQKPAYRKLQPRTQQKMTEDADNLIFLLEIVQKLMATDAGQRALGLKCNTSKIGVSENIDQKDLVSSTKLRLEILLDTMKKPTLYGEDAPLAAKVYQTYLKPFQNIVQVVIDAIDSSNPERLEQAHEQLESLSQKFDEAQKSANIAHFSNETTGLTVSMIEILTILATVRNSFKLKDKILVNNQHQLLDKVEMLSDFFSMIAWDRLCSTSNKGTLLAEKVAPLCQIFIQRWERMNQGYKFVEGRQKPEGSDINPIDWFKMDVKLEKQRMLLLAIHDAALMIPDLDVGTVKFGNVFFGRISHILRPITNPIEPSNLTIEPPKKSQCEDTTARDPQRWKSLQSGSKPIVSVEPAPVVQESIEPLFEDEQELASYISDFLILPEGSEVEDSPVETELSKTAGKLPIAYPQKARATKKKSKGQKSFKSTKANKKTVKGAVSVQSSSKKNEPALTFSSKSRKMRSVINALTEANYHFVRKKGSHELWHNEETNDSFTLPRHDGQLISRRAVTDLNRRVQHNG